MSNFQTALCQFLILVSSAIGGWPSIEVLASPISTRGGCETTGATVTGATIRSRSPHCEALVAETRARCSQQLPADVGLPRDLEIARATSERFSCQTGLQADRRIHSKETRMFQQGVPVRDSNARANVQRRKFNSQQKVIRVSKEGDYITAERFTEHFGVIGATHSAKSSASMRLLMEAAMRMGAGMFIHSAKISAAWDALECAHKAGCKWKIDYGPGTGEKFNWSQYEYRDFGDGKGRADNLMSVFKSLVEVTMRAAGQRESEPFWEFQNAMGFHSLFDIDGIGNGSIDLTRILEYWQSLPQKWEDLNEPERLASLAALAIANEKNIPEQRRSLRLAKNWLTKQMPNLNDRTRSCHREGDGHRNDRCACAGHHAGGHGWRKHLDAGVFGKRGRSHLLVGCDAVRRHRKDDPSRLQKEHPKLHHAPDAEISRTHAGVQAGHYRCRRKCVFHRLGRSGILARFKRMRRRRDMGAPVISERDR